MKKPNIGICAGFEKIIDPISFTGYRKVATSHDYPRSIEEAGGIPFLLSPTKKIATIKQIVSHLDCILFTGGKDINPLLYGEDPRIELADLAPERDEFEVELMKEALKQKKVIFGICRGMQLINVVHGGTLYQDLNKESDEHIKHAHINHPELITHYINIEEKSLLHEIVQTNKLGINSFHHQAIKKLGTGLKVVARSADNIIEAIEKIDQDNFIFGLQWHPEMMSLVNKDAQKIFKKIVEASMINKGE